MTRNLENRVAVITGGSRGLGRGIAVKLASEGAIVNINYVRGEKDAEKTIELVAAAGGKGYMYKADVRNPIQVKSMFRDIYREHKHVDILVNNAGITRDGYFVMMRPQSWHDLVDTHLNAVFHCTKAVIRGMCAARNGVIVHIGSGSSFVPMPGQVNYSASKAGLLGLSRSLAREVAAKNVRVLHVAPGFFQTDMTETLDPAFMQQTYNITPLRRWGTQEELADLVAYLVSDDASYITGQTVVIDGGRGATETDFGF